MCNLNFQFQSKLDRHLSSADHKMFENSLQSIEDGDMEEDTLYAHSEEETIGELLDYDTSSNLGSDVEVEQHDTSDDGSGTIVHN